MKTAYLKYLSSLFLFGSNGIVASYILLASYEIVFFRLFLGSLFLILLSLITRQNLHLRTNSHDLALNILSGIAMGASWLFIYEAYNQLGVSVASLIYYCGPVIVMALSTAIFGEKLTSQKILGFTAVIIGIFLINGHELTHSANLWGLFCASMAAITYALMVITNKKVQTITGITNSTLQLLSGLALVIIFLIIKGGINLDINATGWFWIFIIGIVNTGIGCYLYFSSMNILPVQTVAVCSYLEPVSAIFFSALILHEHLNAIQISGAILIIGGAIYCELTNMKKSK